MAITFHSGASWSSNSGSGAIYSASFDCPALVNGLMVVIPFHGSGGSGNISTSTVTFNGDSLFENAQYIGSAFFSSGAIYHIAPPDNVIANIEVTASATLSGRREFGVLLYEGVDQTTPVEDNDSQYTSSGTTFTLNLTTLTDDAWLVGGFKSDSANLSAGAATTFRTLTNIGGTQFDSIRYGDSNGGKGAPGNYSLIATLASAGDAGEVGIAIRAAAEEGGGSDSFFAVTVPSVSISRRYQVAAY